MRNSFCFIELNNPVCFTTARFGLKRKLIQKLLISCWTIIIVVQGKGKILMLEGVIIILKIFDFLSGVSQSSHLHNNINSRNNGLLGNTHFGAKMGGASVSNNPPTSSLEKSSTYLSQTGLEERPPPPTIYPSSTFTRDNNSSCVSI